MACGCEWYLKMEFIFKPTDCGVNGCKMDILMIELQILNILKI